MITHSVLGFVGAKVATNRKVPLRFLLLSAVCPALPDIDLLALKVGIPYEHFLGHRGFTHSPFFALVLSLVVVWVFFMKSRRFRRRGWLFVYFSLLIGSHGVLDAFTSGGIGVAFLSPFSNERFFFSWRPIQVSPIGAYLNGLRGQALADEFVWLVFPALLIWLIVWVCRNIFVKED